MKEPIKTFKINFESVLVKPAEPKPLPPKESLKIYMDVGFSENKLAVCVRVFRKETNVIRELCQSSFFLGRVGSFLTFQSLVLNGIAAGAVAAYKASPGFTSAMMQGYNEMVEKSKGGVSGAGGPLRAVCGLGTWDEDIQAYTGEYV